MTKSVQLIWRDLTRNLFSTYRPERHYMRGPGPACARRTRPLQGFNAV